MNKDIIKKFNKNFSQLVLSNRIQMYSGFVLGTKYLLFSNNYTEQRRYVGYANSVSLSDVFSSEENNYNDDITNKNFVFGVSAIPVLEEFFLLHEKDKDLINYLSKVISLDKSSTNYVTEIKNPKFFLFAFKNNKININSKNFEEILTFFEKNDLDCYSSLTDLSKFDKSFIKKIENKLTFHSFLIKKYPEKVNEINKVFKINKKSKEVISLVESSLFSCKYMKEDFYIKFPSPSQNFNKDRYWNNLNLIVDFLNKKKDLYGINYVLLTGYTNKDKFFNFIIEKNQNFIYTNEQFYSFILKAFELFKDYPKNYKIKPIDISNADKLYNYYLLKNTVVNEKNQNAFNKYKI